jgi:hypothetical protein
MHIDLVLASLAILIGATIFYTLDEVFTWTPRLTVWLVRKIGED